MRLVERHLNLLLINEQCHHIAPVKSASKLLISHITQRRLTDLHRWYHLILARLGIFDIDAIPPRTHHASHAVARPTCIVCHKWRSRNYRAHHSLVCSRPRCAEVIQTVPELSRFETHIHVHHYHQPVHSDLELKKTSQLPLVPDRPELLGDLQHRVRRDQLERKPLDFPLA